ncbi:unnamed protein product [Cunninghamella echinulata]
MKFISYKFLFAFLLVTLFASNVECAFSPVSALSSAYKVYNWLKSVTNTWSYRLKNKKHSKWHLEKLIYFTAEKTGGEKNVVYHFVLPHNYGVVDQDKNDQKLIEIEINKGDNTDMTAQKVLENLEDIATVTDWYIKVYQNLGYPYEHLTGDGQYVVITPSDYFVAIGPTQEWVSKYVSEWQMNERSKFHCREANELKKSNGQHGTSCDF